MGTRGTYGFRINEQDYFVVSWSDSFPDGLGDDFVNDVRRILRKKGYGWMREKAGMVNVDTEDSTCAQDIETILNTGRVFCEEPYFILDSLMCEYGYLINFDDNTFEVYKGFQEKPHDNGRYAAMDSPREKYYPCALVASFPVSNIPGDWKGVAFPDY